jgi:GT2 family glycosyltransferase
MTCPRVSIIILNWNGLEDTIECLESLKKITYPNYEVIVVDNASSGNDVEVLRGRYQDYIRIIQNEKNYGFAKGNNIGIRYALDEGADYVLVLNNDTVVAPTFLDELVSCCRKEQKIGAVGPKLYHYDNPARVQLPELYEKVGDAPADMETLSGVAFLVGRSVWEQVGLLDEVFYPAYGEDRDFFERLKEHGYRIVCVPASKVYHKMSATARRYPDLSLYLIVKHNFLLARRRRINQSCIASFNHLVNNAFVYFAVSLRAAVERKSIRPVLMFTRGMIEGVIIFLRNPKERW